MKTKKLTKKAEKVKVKTEVVTVDGTSMGSSETKEVEIQAGKEHTLDSTIKVTNPTLWDIDTPITYRVKTQVFKNNRVVDETIRTIWLSFYELDS
ncbi:hypothetical protein [Erysipelothrix piscisicarius]|uniref:hypothetical protein n=1 Tax=Erysipelothrix piscisicarius TaxID=2485784 RepID=UPI002F95BC13